MTLPLNAGTIQLHGLPCPANPGPVSYGLEVGCARTAKHIETGRYATTGSSSHPHPLIYTCTLTQINLPMHTPSPESTLPPQVVLPSIAPSGDYKIKITAIDQDYVPLICIEATLNL